MSVHGISLCKHPHWWCCRTRCPCESPPLSLQSPTTASSSLPRPVLFSSFYFSIHPCTLRPGVRILWVICIWYGCLCACTCFFSRGAGLRIHGGCRHQNRVNCKHSAAKSSARLQGRAQLADGEPPITFTEGGLEGFSRALSPPGFLATGFPSLGASVCAVRDRNG